MYSWCAALLIVLICIWWFRQPRLTQVSARHHKWNMVGGFDNKKQAAEKLARVNAMIIEFMRVLKEKYHVGETEDEMEKEGPAHTTVAMTKQHKMVDFLLTNYNPDAFYETDPRYTSQTSYTVGKGSAMYICLRNKTDPDSLVDDNTLIFTMLHEAAHIANYDGWGHNKKFWTVFKWLLREAVAAGIYIPVDYATHPVVFCGLEIPYQPLNDKTLPEL